MKSCAGCSENKPLDEFSWRSKAKGTKQPYCKACVKTRDASLYLSGKKHGATKEQSDALRLRNRLWLRNYLENHPCVDCGNSDVRVLEFDHLPEFVKSANIAELASSSIEKISSEVAKCEVVCANCHRIRTYSRLNSCYRN